MNFLISRQRRFSENPSQSKIWESEETRMSPSHETIEMVECHKEPLSTNPLIPRTQKISEATKENHQAVFKNLLPTLSISGPSRNQTPEQSPVEEKMPLESEFM